MKNSIQLSKDGKTFVVQIGDRTAFFAANLVKFQLDVPYTNKSGEFISLEKIKEKKKAIAKKRLETLTTQIA